MNVSNLPQGATWEYTTNGNNFVAGSGTSFTLEEGTYTEGVVQVRQIMPDAQPVVVKLRPVTIDTTAPTVVSGANPSGVIGLEQKHTIVFSERVRVLGINVIDAISVSGGVVSISRPGRNSPFYVTPTAETYTMTLAANSVVDIAGNIGPVHAVTITGTAQPYTIEQHGVASTFTLDLDENGALDENDIQLLYRYIATFSRGVDLVRDLTTTGPDTVARNIRYGINSDALNVDRFRDTNIQDYMLIHRKHFRYL